MVLLPPKCTSQRAGREAQPPPPVPQNTVPSAIMQGPITVACGSHFRGHGFQLQIKEETTSGRTHLPTPRPGVQERPLRTSLGALPWAADGLADGLAWSEGGSQRRGTPAPDVKSLSREQGASREPASAPQPLPCGPWG